MHVERISVSAAIYNESRNMVVGILRTNDPSDRLANLWGLPAASLSEVEDDQAAIERIGWQKLGTTLTPVRQIGEKTAMITDELRLTMHLWEATLSELPDFARRNMRDSEVSQYVMWAWMMPEQLIPTAKKGSLCTQLLLKSEGIIYE